MAWTQSENQKLMQVIGWNQFLKGDYTQIQNAINFVQATPAGNLPTADTENFIRADLARIANIDTLLDANVEAAIVSQDAKTKLSAPQQYFALIDYGNRIVARICRTLAVRPIGGGYYARYDSATPDINRL